MNHLTVANISRKLTSVVLTAFALVMLISCSSSDDSIKVPREPSDALISELSSADYSIVLNDMNVEERNSKKLYQHKYHILKVEKDSLIVDSLDWQPVNRTFFEKHENDLGMEIVSHHNGKLSRTAQPVGFGWAIGNEKYGEWEEVGQDSTSTAANTNSNDRRWRHRGPSLLFWYWMLRRPAYQSHYRGYRTASAGGRSYYGAQPNGQTAYGTKSSYQRTKRASFFSRRNSSKTWKSHTTDKTKRSSSRYNSSSTTRSRGGGTGK